MPRKKKQQVKVNDTASLEGLMQETYNDACTQINDAQRNINEITNSIQPEDVDDQTKIAREKSNALKIKDSAIKIKLELAKLQSDIIKHNGNIEEAQDSRISSGAPTFDDFKNVREWVNEANSDNDEE
jgi:hypothetical protein